MQPPGVGISHLCCRTASSTLLVLSLILPPSSLAQTTNPPPSAQPQPPTTFSSSASPSIQPATSIKSDPPAASTTAATPIPEQASYAFNYYFLIVAVVAVLFCLLLLYFGRRKRLKAAVARSHGQRALARDVESWSEGWRSRFGVGRAANTHEATEAQRVEGLDERGEAPPPYVPGSKPPSIRSEDLRRPSTSDSHMQGQTVELRRMRAAASPPEYHENFRESEEPAGVTRPDTAVTASERFGSTRRLMSNSSSYA